MSSRLHPQVSAPEPAREVLLVSSVSGERAIDSAQRAQASLNLFEEHAGLVWRFLRGMGLSSQQAEDALQDVFLIAHQRLPTFEGRSKLSTWICGIARNVAQNHRRRAAQSARSQELDETAFAGGRSPEEEMCGSESARLVHEFSQNLEGGMREVFVLCFLEELRAPEVAEILETPLSTIYSRIRLLRAGLVDLLQGCQEESP